MLWIPLALYRDLAERRVDLAEILGGERDRRRAVVLVEAMELGGAGDRHDPRLLRQQPSERDLRRRHHLLCRDFAQPVDQPLVGLARLGREARHDVAEIIADEAGVGVDRAGQETLAERAERNEADAE